MNALSETLERYGGVNLLPVAVALVGFVLIGAPSSWVTLTVAGLAMGMMIFYTNALVRILYSLLTGRLMNSLQAWRHR